MKEPSDLSIQDENECVFFSVIPNSWRTTGISSRCIGERNQRRAGEEINWTTSECVAAIAYRRERFGARHTRLERIGPRVPDFGSAVRRFDVRCAPQLRLRHRRDGVDVQHVTNPTDLRRLVRHLAIVYRTRCGASWSFQYSRTHPR